MYRNYRIVINIGFRGDICGLYNVSYVVCRIFTSFSPLSCIIVYVWLSWTKYWKVIMWLLMSAMYMHQKEFLVENELIRRFWSMSFLNYKYSKVNQKMLIVFSFSIRNFEKKSSCINWNSDSRNSHLLYSVRES